MSVIKKTLIVTALVVGLVLFLAAILIFFYPPCSNVRECYAVWRGIAGGETNLARLREGYVQQFAASRTLLVFAVPSAEGEAALIVFDRSNRTTRRIGEIGSSLYAPFLSQDQKRLVFARHRKNSPTRDVLSCDVERWQCSTMASVEGTVFSPTELSPDTVVFASSPPRIFDGMVRYVRYDVVLAQAGLSQPITQIGAYSMDTVAITEADLYVCVTRSTEGDEILRFALPDPLSPSILTPQPIIAAKDFSTSDRYFKTPIAAMSAAFDATMIAYKRAESGPNGYNYNLNVVSADLKLLGVRRVQGISGLGMSRAQFVDRKVLFNELFADRYVVKSWDVEANTSETLAEIGYVSVQDSPPITLTIVQRP